MTVFISLKTGRILTLSCVVQVGDKVPSIDLYEKTPANKVNFASLCDGKKVVVFGVPGAFTPGCSKVIKNKANQMLSFLFSLII